MEKKYQCVVEVASWFERKYVWNSIINHKQDTFEEIREGLG